ncbi:hypothetical protein ACMD2_09835 [Ananas comosus]|uniref:PIN domain-containing protein n=1 Tax=Ananas comosus TaxID=4615 RepID=A0A199VKK0_ANACO|nr:hypothetical protein ACMD2_09835 [Ananas comosus]
MPFYVLDKNGIVAITDGALQNAAWLLNMDSIGIAMPQRKPWSSSFLGPDFVEQGRRALDEDQGSLSGYGRALRNRRRCALRIRRVPSLTVREEGLRGSPVFLHAVHGSGRILVDRQREMVLFPSASVIRELDCMKRHENFRRPSSKASSTLQWIEECMENTSLWLYVQSSLETKPVAPTPPITPTLQFIDGNNELGAKIFSSMGNARFRISSQMPSSFTASSDEQKVEEAHKLSIIIGDLELQLSKEQKRSLAFSITNEEEKAGLAFINSATIFTVTGVA